MNQPLMKIQSGQPLMHHAAAMSAAHHLTPEKLRTNPIADTMTARSSS